MNTIDYFPKDLETPLGQAGVLDTLVKEFNASQLASGQFNTLPIVAFGRVNVIGTLFTNTSGVGTVAHNLGYAPAFQVYLDLFRDGTEYIKLPYVTFDIASGLKTDIYHHARTDAQNLQLIATATTLYPTNPNAIFTYFYFIFGNPMPT